MAIAPGSNDQLIYQITINDVSGNEFTTHSLRYSDTQLTLQDGPNLCILLSDRAS